MNKNLLMMPDKNKIKACYDSYSFLFAKILENIEHKLRETIYLASNPTYKTRVKSFSSYYKKILRQKSAEACEGNHLVTLTDMIGIRVICAFLEDLGVVQQQIQDAFEVREIEKKGAEQSFREFGYESIHILVSIPKECIPEDLQGLEIPGNLVCEIQVRTILQDAWAEVEHELIYKSEFNPFDKPLRRKLASINASLTLADMIFQEIRDYQNRLQEELGTRRENFYDMVDDISDREMNINHRKENVRELSSPFEKGSIDDLVLEALHEHNQGNFDKAIAIYSRILESKPTPSDVVCSVILKHRGMAYFARNDYECSLADFKKSFEINPHSERSVYYEGIVYALQGEHERAVECFGKSLALNSFQSHVYFRRSLSYFALGKYDDSLEDLKQAENLGLDNDDLKAFRAKILDKFDMK